MCVFFPFILDIKFVGRTSRGYTGGRSHKISHPPSLCGVCLNFSREKDSAIPFPRRLFFFFFSLISLIADGPHHYHPACSHKGSSHLSPVHALQFFYRDASSALLQLVNQWLNFTYSRSHALLYERRNTNPTFLVRIELTTSALFIAGVQVTY